MENIKDIEYLKRWGHMKNLENYPDTLWRKLEEMESRGLCTKDEKIRILAEKTEFIKCMVCEKSWRMQGMWVCEKCYRDHEKNK